jgi:hypothetical protein
MKFVDPVRAEILFSPETWTSAIYGAKSPALMIRSKFVRCSLESVRRNLNSLLGLPLSGFLRYCECQRFYFGGVIDPVDGMILSTDSAYGLVSEGGRWQIEHEPSGKTISAGDFGVYDPDVELPHPALKEFSAETRLVESVEVDKGYDIALNLSGGFTLTIKCQPDQEEPVDQWWFFYPSHGSLYVRRGRSYFYDVEPSSD